MNRCLLPRLAGSVIALGLLATPCAFAAGKILLAESFDSPGEAASRWTPLKSSIPWVVADGEAAPSGNVIFDLLRTKDFAPVTDGVFDLTVTVRFESALAGGNNRLILQMRDSQSNDGYEVVLSQGTSNNAQIAVIAGSSTTSLTKGLVSKAFSFPVDTFTTVRWTRTAAGEMKVYVDGQEYMSGFDEQFHQFDVLSIGSRAYVPEGDTGPSAMRHIFGSVELKGD
ncbi:MAG: hypothetical protein BGO12_19745 [Verrucomicrobia bacterium 61-8]|nr:hypothetical protein [Verrucomicrobiota bacterium]OJV17447.1 MAG: hypothetical protein BGO12_19745 [Verrucomicrobia bacterium 61-8]